MLLYFQFDLGFIWGWFIVVVGFFAGEKFVREESNTDEELSPEENVAKKSQLSIIQHFVYMRSSKLSDLGLPILMKLLRVSITFPLSQIES